MFIIKNNKFEFINNNKKEFYTTLIVCGLIIFSAVLWSIGYSLATNSKDVVVASAKSESEEENQKEDIEKEAEKSTNEEEAKTEEENKESEENVDTEENNSENDSENTEENQEEVTETTNEEESSEEEVVTPSEDNIIQAPEVEEREEEPVHTHEHIWENIIEDVYHKEEGHWKDVVVKEEVVNKVPIYEMRTKHICNTCNADITNADITAHIKKHKDNGTDKGGYRTEARRVQVDTKEEVTPAVYEKKWIVDKKAWTEEKVVGKKCKTCGETE